MREERVVSILDLSFDEKNRFFDSLDKRREELESKQADQTVCYDNFQQISSAGNIALLNILKMKVASGEMLLPGWQCAANKFLNRFGYCWEDLYLILGDDNEEFMST